MTEKLDPKLFDIRVVERHIRRGIITREQYEEYLESLPDESDESAETAVRFSPSWARRKQDDESDEEQDAD